VRDQSETFFEQVKRSYVVKASQVQCPIHQKNARVEVEGEAFDDFSIDVFTCCEESRQRVHDALQETDHR
jgi:hypothetical protein